MTTWSREMPELKDTGRIGEGTIKRLPWINARDYGVRASDSVDDATQLQNVLDSVAVTGGVVVLPPGEYRLDSDVTVPSGVTLAAANDGVLFTGAGATPAFIDSVTSLIGGESVGNGGSVQHVARVIVSEGSDFGVAPLYEFSAGELAVGDEVEVRATVLTDDHDYSIGVGSSNNLVTENFGNGAAVWRLTRSPKDATRITVGMVGMTTASVDINTDITGSWTLQYGWVENAAPNSNEQFHAVFDVYVRKGS